MIKSAAIKTKNGRIITGHSHGSILMGYELIGEGYKEGFVTKDDKFVDRQEAAKIAFECGQTSENKGTLYSYHLS